MNNNMLRGLGILLCFNILHTQKIKAQKIDYYACSIVEKKLQFVKNYLKYNKIDSTSLVFESVHFLSKLTGINSESDGNYAGQTPTQNDYDKWEKWYLKNKNKIYWNNKLNSVVVKESSRKASLTVGPPPAEISTQNL